MVKVRKMQASNVIVLNSTACILLVSITESFFFTLFVGAAASLMKQRKRTTEAWLVGKIGTSSSKSAGINGFG